MLVRRGGYLLFVVAEVLFVQVALRAALRGLWLIVLLAVVLFCVAAAGGYRHLRKHPARRRP
jgi:hypothetical protein